ncbi:hypothetical protein [Porphyromonas macacae]|uniref:hypothetical protein n=1 Tax=Porphyromonas macacae TaxID=28115 RepID=UPI000B29FFAB|nr:hypothetical protein [Porphyromonas macacae]
MEKENALKFNYGLNDKPGWLPLALYGIQWFLATMPILLIIGSLVGNLQFDTLTEKTFYTQKLFALIGTALSCKYYGDTGYRSSSGLPRCCWWAS